MILNAWFQRGGLALLGVGSLLACLGPALAQQSTGAYTSAPAANPSPAAVTPVAETRANSYELAERSMPVLNPVRISTERRPGEHPLMPALRWASAGLQEMDRSLQDYSSIVVKRERLTDGKLSEEQWMFTKVRHKPFSVYMYFLKPKSLRGQEVVFVEGANQGKMWAHGTGIQAALGTLKLKPTSPIAMRDQHYPITEMGVKNLIQRLLEVGNQDIRYGECEVTFLKGAKINDGASDRVCTCIQVVHPVPRSNFRFHLADLRGRRPQSAHSLRIA